MGSKITRPEVLYNLSNAVKETGEIYPHQICYNLVSGKHFPFHVRVLAKPGSEDPQFSQKVNHHIREVTDRVGGNIAGINVIPLDLDDPYYDIPYKITADLVIPG